MINLDWQAGAACTGIGTEVFYSPEYAQNQVPFETLARVCNPCPVRSECLNHAVKHEEFGYWGGRSERQIRAIRREKRIRLESI